MTTEIVLSVTSEALWLIMLLLLVILIPVLVVGLLISMFQAATQINEMTLSFIPKLLVSVAVCILAGPWILHLLTDYMRRLIENIPFLIG
jgi:flagellar biosynthesis protein FliQ